MAKYYKVGVRVLYDVETFNSQGEPLTYTNNIVGYAPDISKGTQFVGSKIGDDYFIKVDNETILENAIELTSIPEQLLISNVKGVN